MKNSTIMKKMFTLLLCVSPFLTSIAQLPDCTELFFSEYVEGSAKNRALEIYNPTDDTLDLSPYSIKVYASGPNNPNVLQLSGIIPPNDVHVCGFDQAAAPILQQCDITSSELKFTGDDAVGLYKNDTLIDIIGVIGVNPGNTGWQVGTGFTKDNTLRRGFDVRGGTPYWTQSQFEWTVLPMDDVTGLGDNDNVCSATKARFAATSGTFIENDTIISIPVTVINNRTVDVTIDVWHGKPPNTFPCLDPYAELGVDYDVFLNFNGNKQPIQFTALAGTTRTYPIRIILIDDNISDPGQTICLELKDGNNYVAKSPKQFTFFITDDEPVSGISELSGGNVKIYPSPVQAELFIEVKRYEGELTIRVHNIFGQEIMMKKAHAQQGKLKLNTASLASGIYVVSVEGESGRMTRKFVKN